MDNERSASDPNKPRLAWRVITVTLALLAIVQIARHYTAVVVRDDLYAGDAAQHTWWLYRVADPDLFPNDLIARYMSLPVFSPPAYQAIFRLGFDPQRTCESLAIMLAVTSLFLAWRLGHRIGGAPGGAGAIGVFILFALDRYCEGGFPRSFGLPLLLAGMLAIMGRRWIGVGAVFLLCALFYPPMVLNLAPVAGVVFLFGFFVRPASATSLGEPVERPWKSYAAFVLLSLIAVGIIGAFYLKPMPLEIGPWFTYAEAKQMPEWSASGRTAFFRAAKVFWYHSSTAGIGLRREYVAGALILLGLSIAFLPRSIRPEAALLLLFALMTWALAHLMLFTLYLPSRYTSYALPVFGVMWGAGVTGIIANTWCARWKVRAPCVVTASACAIALLIVSVRASSDIRESLLSPPNWNPPVGFEDALRVIATLPKDALIASHPDDANTIPLRARRSVLVNTEVSVAFNRVYYAEMRERLTASFAMLHGIDWTKIDMIADQYGVDYFVLNRARLTRPTPYFEPFETINRQMCELGRAKGWAMLAPAEHRVVYSGGDVMILRVGKAGQP